jgi:ubiquitin carboxyl-terminal hydrolase 36/42
MGHYVAFVKDPRGGWFKMDDHKASPVSPSEVLKVQAYMLFYIHIVPTDAGIDNVKQQTE